MAFCMTRSKKVAEFREFFDDAEYVAKRLSDIAARTIAVGGGCAEYGAHVNASGYTRICFGGTLWQTHRLLWLIHNGDIGDLVIDHKCRNKRCVNLDHMEPVTNAENVRRGKEAAHGGRCSKGHPLAPTKRGWLACPVCRKETHRRDYERRESDPARRQRHRELNRERMRAVRQRAKLPA
jgi:hypothetical protein